MPEKATDPVKTSEVLSAVRIRQKAPCGHMHVVITVDPKTGQELEVFAQVGKSGGLPVSSLEAICRIVSLFLRIGGSLEAVQEQLEGIGATNDHTVHTKDGIVTGLGDALGKAIRRYMEFKAKHGLEAILTGEVDFDASEEGENAETDSVGSAPVGV